MRLITLAAAMLGMLVIASAVRANTITFNGNGGTGFGGPVGNGALTVTDDGTNINFSFAAGTTFSGNNLVLYLDTKPGGYSDTSTLSDTADGGREAISGENPGNPSRTVATFAPGFGADFAITLEPGVFSGLYDLANPANFGFVTSGGLAGSGAGPYTFSYSLASLGLNATDPFSFEGTLISDSAFRSNETIGTSVTTPGSAGDAPNAGFNGTTVFSAANLVVVVPNPAPLRASTALLGLLAIGAIWRRGRSRLALN